MNKTLEDIHYLLTEVFLLYDNVGVDAYDKTNFKTLAERYGYFIDDVDEAIKIKCEYIL